MARLRLVLGLSVAAAALSLGPAAADCAGPSIEVSPRRAAPGDRVGIEGRSWGDACNDTGGGFGCDPPPLGEPIERIRLQLESVDGSDGVDLAVVDADDEYSVQTTFVVTDLPPGQYFVAASGGGHRVRAPLRILEDR